MNDFLTKLFSLLKREREETEIPKKQKVKIMGKQTVYDPHLDMFIAIDDEKILTLSSISTEFGFNPYINYKILTLSSNKEWRVQICPEGDWRGICHSEELHLTVIVGAGGRIATSIDGENWILQNTPFTNTLIDIHWDKILGLFVVVANTGVGNSVLTSPCGTIWTIRSTPFYDFSEAYDWTRIYRSGNQLIATTSANFHKMASIDAINWELIWD